jgi:DNA mismatch repair ATPase MutS
VLQNLRAPELAQLLQWIDEIVEVDAVFDRRSSQRLLQCLFSVKPGVKTTLDLCRQTLGESTQEMERLLQGYHAALSLTELRLNYNGRRGYHFVLPASQRRLAEENGFIQMQTFSKKSISCTTESLSQLNLRCREMIGQILLTTEQEMAGLVEKIQQQVHVLFQVSESVALLDMMVAFGAHVKLAGGDWARPHMDGTASASLVLKQARHPILDRFGEHSLVANDVYATPASNFALITGPNMAGKSTYLRMTALVCLMAHVGCLVPASQANLPLLSRVFTRIASSDCLESCTSTFAGEMRETTYVLRNLGPPALVLVDELGRGTSNRDGASLAWAVAEELLSAPRTFTFFATHYLHLANLKNLYPNVRTLMMAVEPTASRLRFMYHVQEGVCVQRQYCTEFLAELAGTPPRPCHPVPWHLPLCTPYSSRRAQEPAVLAPCAVLTRGPRRRYSVVRHGCGEPPLRRGGLRPGRRALSRGQATRSVCRGRRAARARRYLLDDGRGRAVPLPQAAARPSSAYDGHAAAAAAEPSGRRHARLCVPAVRAALSEDDATLHDERRARRRAPTAIALAPVFSCR